MGSISGKRPQKKIRKSISLPTTPLTECFKFIESDNENDHQAYNANGGLSATVSQGRLQFSPNRTIDAERVSARPDCLPMAMDPAPGPVLSKSRTQKFHKLFKTVPENETPVDYFSCAFIGDILLQGNLYVSQNWFCFYSRIRGRGHLLEIPMESVISITREKTAIIFPNAIGLQTKTDKYAFGSFLTRDSTYKFFVSMWKKSQESKSSGGTTDATNSALRGAEKGPPSISRKDSVKKAAGEASDNQQTNENLSVNLPSQSHSTISKSDSSDQSDSSICIIESNSLDVSDLNNEMGTKDSISGKTDTSNSSPVHKPALKSKGKPGALSKEKKISHVRRKGLEGERLQFPYSVMHCIDRDKTVAALQKSAIKLQKIPRTNLLLAICTILVLFLVMSAIGLTYKILDLEAKISSRAIWTPEDGQNIKYKSYNEIVGLQTTMRDSTAEHVKNVLAANIRVLQEINSSLRELRHSNPREQQPDVCSSESC